jgi:branched-chain amino acid transport system ATP-binding protein
VGAVLGTALLTALPEALRFLKEWYLVLYGVGVILIIIFIPEGLASLGSRWRKRKESESKRAVNASGSNALPDSSSFSLHSIVSHDAHGKDALLVVDSVTQRFGGLVALDGVSVSIMPGTIHAVIGPNGAGKTTFFNLISGGLQPDSGRILLDGEDIVGLPSSEIVRKGIGRAFQVAKLFKSLTVEESLRGALQSPLGRSLQMHGRFPTDDTRDRAHEVMQQLGLEKKADVVSGNLSHGDQKLLDIALALVLNPKVLLLDEPVAGMGPEERTQMIDTVYALWKKGGLTVVLIEHDMEIVFRISQHIHVLSYGKLLAQGNPEQIRNNPAVIEAYLGTPKEARA